MNRARRRSWRATTSAAMVALLSGLAPCIPVSAAPDDDQSYRTATGLLNRGMHDLAAQEYRAFLKDHADHAKAPTARYALAVCLFKLGKPAEAAAELDRIIDLKEFEFAPDALLLRGQCALAAADFASAVRYLHRLDQDHPDYAQRDAAAALEGEALYRAGQTTDARQVFQALAKRSPKQASRDRTDLFWALSEIADGEVKPAAKRLADLRRRSPEAAIAAQAALTEAQCRHQLGDPKTAGKLYQDAIASKDKAVEPEALLGLAQLARASSDVAQAGRLLDDLLARFADSTAAGPARVERAHAFLDEEKPEQALAILKPLLGTDLSSSPLADDAAYWSARAELALGQAGAAAERLRVATRAYPDSPLAPNMTYDLAVALIRSGSEAQAAAILEQLRAQFPQHELVPDALFSQASVLHGQAEYEPSAKLCAEFLKSYAAHPRAAAARLLLAENEYLAGKYDLAARDYGRFTDEYPADAQAARASIRRGLALAKLGDADKARPVLEAGVNAAAGADPALVEVACATLGDLAFTAADWKAAEKWFGRIAETAHDPDRQADALLKLGLSIHRQARPGDALEVYDRLLKTAPSGPGALQTTFERGQALLELARFDEARQAFQAVVAQDKAGDHRFTLHATRHLASIATKQGRPDEAASLLSGLAESDDPAAADVLYQQGLALLSAGKPDEAEKALDSFLKRFAQDNRVAQARAYRALAISRQSRFDAALDEIRALEKTSPTLDPALVQTLRYEKAWALKELNKADEAAAAYRELLAAPGQSLAPELRGHAALDLAQLNVAAGRFDEALKLLEAEAAPNESASPSARLAEQAAYMRGVCELRLEQFARAAATFRQFLDRFPDSTQAISASLLCGEALLRAGKPQDAIPHLTRAADGSSDSATLAPALLRLGEACAAARRWSPSEEAFARYLAKFADQELWFQARFGVGWAREHQSRHEAAIEAYSNVVANHKGPTAARAQFQIGECLYAMKKHDDAVRELLKVDILYAYPEWSAAALFEAGRCLAESGHPDEAKRQFQEVVDRFPDTDWAKPARERLAAAAPAPLPGRAASVPTRPGT